MNTVFCTVAYGHNGMLFWRSIVARRDIADVFYMRIPILVDLTFPERHGIALSNRQWYLTSNRGSLELV